MKKLTIVITLLLLFTNSAFADEGEKEFCGFTYSIHTNSTTSNVYLGCSGSAEALELITFNPTSLEVINQFPLNGLLQDVFPMADGKSLLILLVETDGDPDTTEGSLQKVDAVTGEVITEYEFDRAPLAMAVDPEQKFAYVASGLSFDITSSVEKISLTDFTLKNSLLFGQTPDDVSITPDGTRLYVKSEEIFIKDDEGETEFYWKIGVIDTSNMTIVDGIRIPVMPASLEMGINNKLYISNSMPMSEENMDYSLIIADTTTNEIVEMLSFSEVGIWDMDYDPVKNMIYGTACPRTFLDEQTGQYTHETSNTILAINLADNTHKVFQLGEIPLWDIAVVSFGGNKQQRIIGIVETESPLVYYKDL